ncbi:transglycosylase domain-containing protein [Salininema proteolyticum]|uniref:Transglycosylase domain-containing protein n=2 Tax=Salininema proteolyticum TaxID=1607685 RepID=A0ABV8U0H0_9ACTN
MGPFALMAGVVVALIFAPLAIAVGGVTKVGSETALDLPQDLVLPPAPKASVLYANDGVTPIAEFGDQYRIALSSDEIPDMVKNAVVAVEDERFYEHNGVDPTGVMRAAVTNATSGGVSEGASTITMQYVRQVLAYTATSPEEVAAATDVTPGRKIREMGYALSLEKQMSKDEVLTGYLNTVYFGHGAYGVGAAAKVYFNKGVDDLTTAEAALLAGLIQAPSSYDPISGSTEAALLRREHVLGRMKANDYIDKAEFAESKEEPIELDPQQEDAKGTGAYNSEYGFFVDYFETWWEKQEAFGETPAQRRARLNRGGYEIVSTLDLDMQTAAEEAIAEEFPKKDPMALGTAAVEPGTGKIQVMAINRDFSLDVSKNGPNTGGAGKGSYPNTTNPLLSYGGSHGGSTFKLFTQIAALEQGFDLDYSIYSPHKYKTSEPTDPGPAACGRYWCPSNASESMAGNRNMYDAFGMSVNTYYVQLMERVGGDKAVDVAERMGIKYYNSPDQSLAEDGELKYTLGMTNTTALDEAAAYAVLPADGQYCEPIPVSTVTTGKGDVTEFDSTCEQAIDTEVARAALDTARCTTGMGAATGSCGSWGTADDMYKKVGGPVAGKTGSTDNNVSSWFAGFTPNSAVASFVGNPDVPQDGVPDSKLRSPASVATEVLKTQWAENGKGGFTPPNEHTG